MKGKEQQKVQQSSHGATTSTRPSGEISAPPSWIRSGNKKLGRVVNILSSPEIFDESTAKERMCTSCMKFIEYLGFYLLQICVFAILIYISYVCFYFSDTLKNTALHAWLGTLGFIFILSEGTIIHCNRNIMTMYLHRYVKHIIHLIIQTIGIIVGIYAVFAQIYCKGIQYRHLHTILGFAALISCCISFSIGIIYYVQSFYRSLSKRRMKRTGHILCGMVALLTAYISLYFAYDTNFITTHTGPDIILLFKVITLIAGILITLIPLKSLLKPIIYI